MHDVITIGSATVDLFMKSQKFHLQPAEANNPDAGVLLCERYGGKLDIDQFEMHSGGAGTNTAAAFSRLGFKTAAVVEIGKDIFGQIVWDELKRENVDTDFVITEKGEETAVSVLLISGEGGRSILTYRGAASQLEARDLPWQALLETRWVHLSNISGNKELLTRLFDHLKNSTVGLSWNPGRPELEMLARGELKVAAIPCDIFFVNKEEWELLADLQSEIKKNFAMVIVTDGRAGGELFMKSEYHLPYTAIETSTVQETGAGDSFGAGFVAAHLLGRPVPECIEWGKRNAAAVVQQMGAKKGLLYRKDFKV